ncbi:winged helix DNA-binding domain-containing protein [Actinotalea sp. M2MS4P-6]|uniref:winged helix-turn-helix domain-containing protein n=1 Tax=Actinotalea sp. M2MS4P-6 TaxID=2983762 RepID=UPI0021E3B8EC|nr:crosslink repair DNA glycosylase YcaQ family protein [Actinotalea sp. M2MS4P-6]MCV2394141.1 winged helix DNA-binding domain-containing protein [Actinotalea sp. M2MS4P-6]
MTAELSLSQARRVALRAQGLDAPRPAAGPVGLRRLMSVVDRLGLLQIDSVSVLARAHLVPVFSRLGPYDTSLLDRAAGRRPRRLTEAWAHEASLVPPSTWRLLGFDRRSWRDRMWSKPDGFVHTHAAELDEVRRIVRDEGPVTARQVHEHFAHTHPHAGGGWWDWSVAKEALERLFFVGELAIAGRTTTFERRYDLVERVLPGEVLAAPEPDEADAVRSLVAIAARAHGVATVGCLADYFRMSVARAKQAADELVEAGELEPVEVPGWRRPAYLHRAATVPRRATGRALLSPFDPLVFERRRLEELFGTRYRIEIYTPAAKRVHGYYVLPFLLGERIAARVDLKADRSRGTLQVRAAHHEQHGDRRAPPRESIAVELAAELDLMADWLGLGEVAVVPEAFGDLTVDLAAAIRPRTSTLRA